MVFYIKGDVVQRGHRSPTLPSSGNVRDHMLRKDVNSSRHYVSVIIFSNLSAKLELMCFVNLFYK